MGVDVVASEQSRISSSARELFRDFASVAGNNGVRAIAYVTVGALLEGIGISLLVPLLGLLFGARAIPGRLGSHITALFAYLGANSPFSQLVLLLSVFGALLVLRAVVISARDILVGELQIAFVEMQRLRIVRNLAAANWEYIARLRHSRITHLMSGDIQRLGVGILFVLRGGVASAMLLVQCALAFWLAPLPAALFLLVLIVGAVGLGPMFVRARAFGGFVADANLSLLNSTVQFLGGLKLAISQNLETSFVEDASRTLDSLVERQVDYLKQHARSRAAMTALSALAGLTLLLAGIGVFHMAPSILIALLLIVTRMMGPVEQIQQGAHQFAHFLAVYEKIQQLSRELVWAARRDDVRQPSVPLPTGAIRFESVSFRHDDTVNTAGTGVSGLALTITPGEFLGITGSSGVGKTTFADLLVGLYPPQSGRIVVGGVALEGAMLPIWRNALSYVSQDPFLLHDSIRNNLSWGNTHACEQEMWDMLAIAGADGTVRQMDNGLDMIVGERGTLVSGGERQRIALARALLRRPKLLVLDEATGAIDSAGERDILVRLRAISPRPTIVLIAHRTQNLRVCDRVLRFEAEGPAIQVS